MLDKEFKTFTESGFGTSDTLMPQYQITKLAQDTYQIYNFAERTAELCSARGALQKVASIRGGKYLNHDLSQKIINMNEFSTYTVADSALKISKRASADADFEPWKLVVAADGNEYFVSATSEEEEQPVVKKQAASAVKHVYTIRVTAHNLKELTKIADMVETTIPAIQNTTQVLPEQNTIVFDELSEETPQEAQASIQKELEGGEIYLPNTSVCVHNDSCPCGCGQKAILPEIPCEQVSSCAYNEPCDIPQGQFVLICPGNPMCSFASNIYTLKKYASKRSDYRIYNDKREVVAEVKAGIELDPSKKTFADELKAFLDEQLQKKAEDGKVTIYDQTGQEKDPSSEPQQGDRVVGADGIATTIKEVEESLDAPLQATAEEVYTGKDPEDTKATGDDEVKKWKGMREVDDKFVVYITESRERVFDTADEAINYLTRE